MAQRLNIDIVARDKTKQAFGALGKSLGRLKSAVFSLQSAFIGLGAGLVIKNLVNTGQELENLRVRLKFLLKDTIEGAKAFENMVKFASKVPFSLEEIQSGSGILATVTDNADDLQKMLEITGNVAATTGLDFRTAAEQIQRSFSAGIGAADLFREKGVRNMLGFKAGATVSIEDTVAAFEKVFGRGGRFGQATDELAKTFTGTVSMIGDKIFAFKKTLLEEGFFEELKKQFGDLDKFLADNNEQLDNLAKTIGENLAKALRGAVDAGKKVTPILMDIKNIFAGIIKTFNNLPEVFQQAGIIGAFLLGKKGFVGLAIILDFINRVENFADKFGNKPVVLPFEHELSGDKEISERNKIIHDTAQAIEKAKAKEIELNEEFLKTQQLILDIEHDMSIRVPSATEKAMMKFQEMNDSVLKGFEDKVNNIRMIIAESINNGITTMSQGIARSIVLGEKLSDTFKNMAEKFLINIVAALVEIVARKVAELAIEKLITREKEKQAALSGGGSLFSMARSFLGFAKGGAVSKGKPIIVGEQGAEMFIPNSTGQITQAARGTGGSAVNVNFTINTIDSRGFDQALVENRGTITSIINNALAEKGRGELI